jgi:hypothetical protein
MVCIIVCQATNQFSCVTAQPLDAAAGATTTDGYDSAPEQAERQPLPYEASSTEPTYTAGEPPELPAAATTQEPNEDELLSSVFSQTNKLRDSDRERIVAFLAKRAVLGPDERDVQQVCVCVYVCVCVCACACVCACVRACVCVRAREGVTPCRVASQYMPRGTTAATLTFQALTHTLRTPSTNKHTFISAFTYRWCCTKRERRPRQTALYLSSKSSSK